MRESARGRTKTPLSGVGQLSEEFKSRPKNALQQLPKFITGIAFASSSGFLLYASFSPIGSPVLAWLGLVPLFFALRQAGYGQAFCLGFLTGFILCGLQVSWLLAVSDLTPVAFTTIIAYAALYFALFAVLYVFIARRTRLPALLFTPFIWVTLEYLRSNLSFLAIPFVLLGHSQYSQLAVIQIASITSVWGVSFLIVLANAALAEGIVWLVKRFSDKSDSMERSPKMAIPLALLLVMAVMLITYLWGAAQISQLEANSGKILKVSVIQGNVPQHQKWDPKFASAILDHYRQLTLTAAAEHPDLIVWPESATPGYLQGSPQVYNAVDQMVQQIDVPLVLGSASYEKRINGGKRRVNLRNSAFLIDPIDKIRFTYDKQKLLPFAEYTPLEGIFSWPRWLVPSKGKYLAGTQYTIFEVRQNRFGIVICWEVFFPDLFRIFVRDGAQFMLNLANEAWFGDSDASRQLLAITVFRAVENRVALVRATNTGVSSLIDPTGRIRARIRDDEGRDVMVTGVMTVAVPEGLAPSFYTLQGDVFALGVVILAVISVILASLPMSIRSRLYILESRKPHDGTFIFNR